MIGSTINRNNNPFLPRRADHVSSRHLIEYFANHAKSAPIKERGHHLIIGASGSGKTTAFRYFSLADQLSGGGIQNIEPLFIGVYISLKENIEIWKRKSVTRELISLYEEYLNISIGSRIIDTIHRCHKNTIYDIDRCQDNLVQLIINLFKIKNTLSNYDDILNEIDNVKRNLLEYVNTEAYSATNRIVNTSSIVTFIPNLCQYIIQYSPFLRTNSVPFYLFLDYYDELQPWQQKVVNTLLQRPSIGYFVKLGSRPFGIYDYNNISERTPGDIVKSCVRAGIEHIRLISD